MPLTNQDNPYTVVPPPFQQPILQPQIYPPGATPICPQLGPEFLPLYPPLVIPERRRRYRDEDPAISVNITASQTVSGGLLFDNTIFKRGKIDRSGHSIVIRRRGTYIVTFDANVSLIIPTPPPPSPPSPPSSILPTATATFTLQPMNMVIANLIVSSPTTQLLSGSQIIDLHKDTYLSITDILSNATVLSGTFSVVKVSDRRQLDVIV
jgi:hypothetical protein